ncbi:anti-FecI sigma factor, FecR [Rhizobium sp. CF080]|uniref:FecR family protein n=1 Tax=Rhizobium sp. (strain CF080) TaxID=1144310 RepID=UPI0002719299|nr:FecR family protein [Rhizobium sp. CF080]EUB99195.1 anti-FecI sigma factor, FecR [Rhizobium sp. CF080]
MTEQQTVSQTHDEIREQARNWLVCLLGNPSEANRREFETWRDADPAHAEAFGRIADLWDETEQPGQRLAREEADELAVYLKAMERAGKQRRTGRRLTVVSIVLAAMVAGAVAFESPGLLRTFEADYVADRGQRRAVTLPDGSKVLLDADSALAEDYRPGERRVRLLGGAAFFDVVPGAAPFIVSAAGGEIKVLGTGFDVRLVDDGGIVTLDHGKVAVTHDTSPGETILMPGEQVHFGQAGIGPVQAVNLDDALAWREGRFIFYRARLGDVLKEIERYRRGRIIVVSPSLSDERVTGSLPLADPEAALASLQASVGFRLLGAGRWLTVIAP